MIRMRYGLCMLLVAALCMCAGCKNEKGTTQSAGEAPDENEAQHFIPKDVEPVQTQTQSAETQTAETQTALSPLPADVNRLKDGKYLLRYVWRKGDILAWQVTHRNRTVTTITDTTESVDAFCLSEKVWEVEDVDGDGSGTFTNTVPWANMREKRDDGRLRTYDSRRDMVAPDSFGSVPESLGVELSKITLNARGAQVQREDFHPTTVIQQANQAYVVIPFPEEPVAVGASWDYKYPVYVPLGTGDLTRIDMMQKYTLREVDGEVATIVYGTKILSPVQDPAIRAQLIDRLYDGTFRFSLEKGCSLSITQKVDQSVIGFRGGASSVKMLIEFNEVFLEENARHVPPAAVEQYGPTYTPPDELPETRIEPELPLTPVRQTPPEEETRSSLQEVPLPPGALDKL